MDKVGYICVIVNKALPKIVRIVDTVDIGYLMLEANDYDPWRSYPYVCEMALRVNGYREKKKALDALLEDFSDGTGGYCVPCEKVHGYLSLMDGELQVAVNFEER